MHHPFVLKVVLQNRNIIATRSQVYTRTERNPSIIVNFLNPYEAIGRKCLAEAYHHIERKSLQRQLITGLVSQSPARLRLASSNLRAANSPFRLPSRVFRLGLAE